MVNDYILGLNLDISSIGWSVIEVDSHEYPINIIDCGVRAFDSAEIPKTGGSLA